MVRDNFKYIWKDVLGITESNYDAYLSNFNYLKYVYFNGGVFLDCFSPKFPSPAFNKTTNNLIRMFTQDPNNYQAITIALIISITKKCYYRCEHCYAIQTLGSEDVLTIDACFWWWQCTGIIPWGGRSPYTNGTRCFPIPGVLTCHLTRLADGRCRAQTGRAYSM